jgi:hypothetical protein
MIRNSAARGKTALARGRWYHVAGTVDSDGSARVFIDGVEAGVRQVNGRPPMGGGHNPIVIGAAFNTPSRSKPTERLRGVVDDLMIYDRALSAAEIHTLAHRVVAPDDPAPAVAEAASSGATPSPAPTEPMYLCAEPETGSISAPLEVHHDVTASEGRYIAVAAGRNAKRAAPSSGQSVVHFEVPAAGTFKVWGRLIAPTAGDDSFWLRVDAGPWIKWNDIPVAPQWRWAVLRDDTTDRVPTFDLASGSHTLTIAYREDGARLDQLLVTSDLAFSPTGAGR